MSYNATYVAAHNTFVPVPEQLDKVLQYLSAHGIVGQAITTGAPVFGESFQWTPGPNGTIAAEDYLDDWDFRRISVFMAAEEMPIGDDSGQAFETRFYVRFIEAGALKDEFVKALSELLGTKLFTWTGHY